MGSPVGFYCALGIFGFWVPANTVGGNFSVGAEINGSHHSAVVTIRTSV